MINIGFISIHLYSIILLIAILSASFLIIKEGKKQGDSENFWTNLIFYTVIFGILGARIYFVLFNLDYYLNSPEEIFMIWHGGLAIHGGIINGLITILLYCYKHKKNSLKILDIIVVGLILAQAIGRWGNFFNGEAHGPETSLDSLQYLPQFIIDGMHINGVYYIPTFLYESAWCLLGFIFLLLIRKFLKLKPGILTSIYLIWYGLGRFCIESLRTDSLMLMNFKIAQIISLVMIISGIILFIFSYKNKGEVK